MNEAAILEIDNYEPGQPSRLRRALCELTGGHNNVVLGAWKGGECFAIRLACSRCGKRTMWYGLPAKPADEPVP